MAIWLKRAGRWQRAHSLPLYLPPGYLRLFPGRPPGPSWRAAGQFKAYGADSLPEFLQGLLKACRRPGGGAQPGLWEVKPDSNVIPVDRIPPFQPDQLCSPGLELARLRKPPDKWLLTLHLARPSPTLLAVQTERYLASWHRGLEELLRACQAA